MFFTIKYFSLQNPRNHPASPRHCICAVRDAQYSDVPNNAMLRNEFRQVVLGVKIFVAHMSEYLGQF